MNRAQTYFGFIQILTVEMPGRGTGSQASSKPRPKENHEDTISHPEQDGDPNLTNVIDGPDIQSLAIDHSELEEIKRNFLESSRQLHSQGNEKKKVLVRRQQHQVTNSKQRKKVLVTRRDKSGGDPTGVKKQTPLAMEEGINERRILGTREQLIRSAISHGDLDPESELAKSVTLSQSPFLDFDTETQFFQPRVSAQTRQHATRDETAALDNWRAKMIERKKIQGRISRLLDKEPGELVQSSADMYRARQEQRDVIDRAIPAIDYGKGYRVGSEFWRQYESIGDDMGGLKMSLKVSERGQPADVARIGKPDIIKEEVGENYKLRNVNTGGYMATRRAEVEHILSEFDAYEPAYSDLIVLGKEVGKGGVEQSTPRSEWDSTVHEAEDVATPSETVPGPAITINGLTMTFGDEENQEAETAIYFDKFRGEMEIKHLRLENIGTTTVYYNWSRQFRAPSFKHQRRDETQRFYFNASPGSVLPGATKLIPIAFESPNGGKFAETWNLNARPRLGTFKITLRGCSHSLEEKHDDNKKNRERIEEHLKRQQAKSAAAHVLKSILAEVKTPPRCPSPDELYFTEEERFERLNQKLHYDYVSVRELAAIWATHWPEENWDLSLRTLRQRLIELSTSTEEPEEADALEEQQNKLNQLARKMYTKKPAHPPLTPSDHVKMQLGYAIEKLTVEMVNMRKRMNIAPAVPFPLMEERPTSSQLSMTSAKGKEDTKARKSASATKKEKSAKGARKPEKDDKKKKKSKTDVKNKKPEKEDEGHTSPMSSYSEMDSNINGLNINDPANEKLKAAYIAKVSSLSHEILENAMDRIASIL